MKRFCCCGRALLGLAVWTVLLFDALAASAGGFKPAPGRGVPEVYTVVLAEGVASRPQNPRQDLPPVAQVAQELGRAHGGRVEEVWEHALQGFVIRMPEARARKLAEDPRVLVVEQDFPVPFSAPVGDCYYGTPVSNTRPLPSNTFSPQTLSCSDADPQNDLTAGAPLCADNWGIDRIDQLSAARDQRYYFTNNGRNSTTTSHIYVMDTGIRRTHREFRDAGGVSRVIGGADARSNPVNDSPSADTGDCYGHGTHVAGIIGGRTYGVAKDSILHSVRIIGCPGSSVSEPFVTTVTRALNWISGNAQRPAVINWSGGNDLTVVANETLGSAVQGVLNQGIVLVQAAGNQSPDFDPARPQFLRDACDWSFGERYPRVIVAGGMDEYDGRWTRRPSSDVDDARYCPSQYGSVIRDCGSNTGSCVDIWAPSAHVISSNMNGDDLACRLSGTSMAAPHVAGVVAVYLEDHPNASVLEVERALRSRGTWNVLETGGSDPNSIGPDADNVVLYSDTLSLGSDLAPVASYVASCQGRTCSFNATGSTDDFGITSYSWRFGDGTTGTGSVIEHRFPPNFSGRVTLTVTDGLQHTDHFSRVVTVGSDDVPVASFIVACGGNQTCLFDGSDSTDDLGIVSWSWTFGDGTTGSGVTTSHRYPSAGSFNVTLRVTDTTGNIHQVTQTVTTSVDSPPFAGFYVGCSNRTCTADSETSGDDFGIVNYTWTWGDGQTTSGGSSASAPSHTYAADGTYTITLVVRDAANQTATTSRTVTVGGSVTASFTLTCTGRSCDTDASASTGGIVSYYWDWEDESTTTTTGPTAHHDYGYDGTFTVRLTVYDANGNTAGASRTVTAEDGPPVAGFSVVCISLTCTADAETSGDDLGIVNYTWTWGDGQTTSGGSSASAPSHTYGAAGTYTITLVVRDAANQTATASRTVTVSGSLTASFTITCTGRSCDTNASASTGGVVSYFWDWDDESMDTTSGPTAHHDYAYDATFTVRLTVYDANGNTAGTSRTVTVSSGQTGPTASFTITCNGRTCDVNASASTGGVVSYYWDWDDESTTTTSGPTAQHVYGYDGTFTVRLTVYDANGNTGGTSRVVTIGGL